MPKAWIIGVVAFLTAAAVQAAPQRTELDAVDPDGTFVGKVVICNDCKDPSAGGSAECPSGAAEGWRNGAPCGSCLLQANWGVMLEYAYDVHVAGTLVDAAGKPVAGRYVKMFLPNGWSIRTRTIDDGSFRLILGATLERKGKSPVVVDVGSRLDTVKGEDPHYSLYMVPKDYKPCTDAAPMKPAPGIDPGSL